jgi:hypothetical protein
VHAHADRSRIEIDSHHQHVLPKTFLVDGFVGGTWKLVRGGGIIRLEITPFAEIGRDDRVALAEEAMLLLGFLAAGAVDDVRVSVRFTSADA